MPEQRRSRELAKALNKRLGKKAKRGFRGHPIASIAFYGPTDRLATKMVVSIVQRADQDPDEYPQSKWFTADVDVRHDPAIMAQAIDFVEEHGAQSVAMFDRIIGCPHEEGKDYEGPICPQCPFWANRDRWTGKIIR